MPSGDYLDRKSKETVNVSKVIWILATNALDATILNFFDKSESLLGDEEKRDKLVGKLSKDLRSIFRQKFQVSILPR
jgi:hypothetical protein